MRYRYTLEEAVTLIGGTLQNYLDIADVVECQQSITADVRAWCLANLPEGTPCRVSYLQTADANEIQVRVDTREEHEELILA